MHKKRPLAPLGVTERGMFGVTERGALGVTERGMFGATEREVLGVTERGMFGATKMGLGVIKGLIATHANLVSDSLYRLSLRIGKGLKFCL